MKWFARLVIAITLTAAAVAALTWAGWPRPRSVVAIEAAVCVGFLDTGDDSTPPYRVIRHDHSLEEGARYRSIMPEDPASFWFLAPDGRVLGPWRAGRLEHAIGFDGAGRLLAETTSHYRGYALGRYDPVTGREERLLTLDGPTPHCARLSGDLSTLALAWCVPPAFDLYDLTDGRKLARLDFPARDGVLEAWRRDSHHPIVPFVTLAWALSPDGRELLLAEGWDGHRRVGPPGVEVYEVATGRLARRLPHPLDPADPPEPRDFGVVWATLLGEGEVAGRLSALANEWVKGEESGWAAYDRAHSGKLRPTLPGRREREVAAHGGQALWLRDDPAEFRVLGPGGVPAADWRPFPDEFSDGHKLTTRLQPGRPAAVHSTHEYGTKPLSPWLRKLARRLGRPPDVDAATSAYLYHDWSAGESRRVHGVPAGRHTSAVGPNDLAILTPTPTGGTLALWDLPPPRQPWPWSVPAGVALGVLLTTAGVRLRQSC